MPESSISLRKNRIAILGSCVSRDSFDLVKEHTFDVIAYFARSSIASYLSYPELDESILDRVASPFQRRMLRGDMCKTYLADFRDLDVDWRIVDFIDERFALARHPSGHLRTLSGEYTAVTNADEHFTIIPAESDEHLSLWKEGWRKVSQELFRKGILNRTIINKVFWAEADLSGKRFNNGSISYIHRANDRLAAMYEFVQNTSPEIRWICYDRSIFVGDPQHRWGLSPFHYQKAVYEHMLRCLDTCSQI